MIMNKPTHQDIDKLVRAIVLPFYHVRRDTLLPIGERRWENDAEHSWSVTILACALAPIIDPDLDLGKVAQLATVHDLVEVYAEDTSTFADQHKIASKADREQKAFLRIQAELIRFPWVVSTIHEYELKETNESRYVSAIDKYITVLYDYIDEGRQLREQKITKNRYHEGLEVQRKKVQQHAGVAQYYEEVRAALDTYPEFFYTEK